MDIPTCKPYPSDVTDDEWALSRPTWSLNDRSCEVFNGLRWFGRTGEPYGMLPHDLPPWAGVYQQTQRWLRVSVFATMEPCHDLRVLCRERWYMGVRTAI